MARKATATKYFVRSINGDVAQIINARQEISRESNDYGVYWKFEEVTKDEFIKEVKKDDKVYCIKTLSNKFIEVDKDNINNFILS